MKIFKTFNDSINERLYFRGSKWLSSPDDLVQWFILTKLEKDIHMIFVLKIVDKLNYVLVMQYFVESNLVEELS